MKDTVSRLQRWYAAQCDDNWEHQYGVKIDTLDNPGWSLEVDLTGTNLMNREFVEVDLERSELDWVRCRLQGAKFEGFGGPENLCEILGTFLSWAGESDA